MDYSLAIALKDLTKAVLKVANGDSGIHISNDGYGGKRVYVYSLDRGNN